ncbi:MAG: hypothetical protein AB8G95_17510 [Anaerolineae bacterium]
MKKYIILGSLALFSLFLLLAFSTYWFIFGLDSWLFSRDLQRPVDQRLLFVGNSFTYQNDIDQMVESLLEAQPGGADTVFSTRAAFGGYRLYDHIDDILDNEEGSPIRQFLLDGNEQTRNWDLVILQEQVEIPGLDTYEQERETSHASGLKLGELAQNAGAKVMLLETWAGAYDPADPENPFPPFDVVQGYLVQANSDLATIMQERGIDTAVAPAGRAFQIVYSEVMAEGVEPTTGDNRFLALYSGDRKHASLAGSYLTAAVIVAQYTQSPISTTEWIPLGLDKEFAVYLRQVADKAVFE